MPLLTLLAIPALNKAEQVADRGNAKAKALVTYYVGQGVGLIDGIRSAGQVVQDFKSGFADALADLEALVAE